MSLFAREQRSITFQDLWGKGYDVTGWSNTYTGEHVNSDSAMRLSSVWACVSLLADVVSSMPVDVYRMSGSVRQRVGTQPSIIAAPSLLVSRREWVYQAMTSLLLRGNAYGMVVERDALLRPAAVEWLNPDGVEVDQKSSLVRPVYRVEGREVDRDNLVHLRANVPAGSVKGLSPIEYQRQTVAVGLAAQKFGAQWFGEGAHPSAILASDQKITQEQATTIKDRFVKAIRGKREPAVLGAGLKYQQIQVSANESQFLETQRATVNDIARIFKIPAEMIGGTTESQSLNYSSREQRNLDFLTYAVQPWLVKLEDALTGMIAGPQFVKFNADSLLRTDLKARYEAYGIALKNHFKTIDEVRALEDDAPLDNGEQFPPGKQTPNETGGRDAA